MTYQHINKSLYFSIFSQPNEPYDGSKQEDIRKMIYFLHLSGTALRAADVNKLDEGENLSQFIMNRPMKNLCHKREYF